MLDECCSGGLAVAVDEVYHSGRESSLANELAKDKDAQGSLFRCLEDDGVATCQGRTELPRRHGQWVVPWNDLTDDTDGLAEGICEFLGGGADGLAISLVGPAGVVADCADGFCEIDFKCFVVRFAWDC